MLGAKPRLWERKSSDLEESLGEALSKAGLVYESVPIGYMGDYRVKVRGHWVWVYVNGCYWHQCPECYPPEDRQREIAELFGRVYRVEETGELEAVSQRIGDLESGGREREGKRLFWLVKREEWWRRTCRQSNHHVYTCQLWEHELNSHGWDWAVEQITMTAHRRDR